jgi:hypothetical protein
LTLDVVLRTTPDKCIQLVVGQPVHDSAVDKGPSGKAAGATVKRAREAFTAETALKAPVARTNWLMFRNARHAGDRNATKKFPYNKKAW